MKVFVTGATGFVGSAVVQELLGAGHQVVGLARSEGNAAALQAAGAVVHPGSLEEPESLRSGAQGADGVIHCGFIHDFSRMAENCAIDARAIQALGEALAGSDRPLLVTSGVAMLAPGRLAVEDDRLPDDFPFPRRSEQAARALLERGVKAGVVRLPPTVHGEGDHGFVPILIALARQTGVSAWPGEGSNPWSAVHRADAARVYRLALERNQAGAHYHAVAEPSIPFRAIATAIGRGLGLPAESRPAEHFGWFAHFAGMDAATSSEKTRAWLGWEPTQPTLMHDLEQAGYF